jgi:Alpha/beta hydrolase of unknown function (DUF900)
MNSLKHDPDLFSARMTLLIHTIVAFVPSRVLATIIAFVVTYHSVGLAQTPTPCCTGEIWEISTRHLPGSACRGANPIPFEVHRWNTCRWERSTIEEATGTTGTTGATGTSGLVPLTIIYVHGNFMERDNARERVRIVNSHVARCATESYRLLMFSWPSQRDHRIIQDTRENAQLADAEAYYLASLLQMVTATSEKVSLLGFSFGARTVIGALHLDAGGTLPCMPVLPPSVAHAPYRVSLVAPAVDRNWLQPNGKHSYAMNNIDQLVNLYNSKDPILRRLPTRSQLALPVSKPSQTLVRRSL